MVRAPFARPSAVAEETMTDAVSLAGIAAGWLT